MKKIILLFSLLGSLSLLAQVPQGINYQSVVRANNGTVLANQSMTLQFNYVDKADGSIDLIESFVTASDEFGVVNLVLGTGDASINSFGELDWTNQFRLDIFVNLGSGFAILGSQDLESVPYALNAGHADMTLGDLTDVETTGALSGEVLMFDGTSWIPADISNNSGFGLPFLGSDPNLVSFGITNTSALGGSAIYGQTSVNAANATGVKGQSTGATGRGVYGTATGAGAYGVLGENTEGTAVRGTTSGAGANGVHGVANSATGVGVRGESNEGTGVLAYSGDGVAVNASSISGDAIYANSTSGYALSTSGNIKIAGGNTNPGAGKVLTSDASGNATWQAMATTPKIAFRSGNIGASIPENQSTKVEFSSEIYDFGNCFTPYAGSTNSNSSVFVAPVTGLYHFDGAIGFENTGDTFNYLAEFTGVTIIAKTANDVFIAHVSSNKAIVSSSLSFANFNSTLGGDIYLQAGSKVYLEVYQTNDENSAETPTYKTFFSGHLVFAL